MRHHNWLLIAIIAIEHTLPKSWKEFGTFLSTQHALLLRMINRTEDEDTGMLRSSLIFFVQAANSWSLNRWRKLISQPMHKTKR